MMVTILPFEDEAALYALCQPRTGACAGYHRCWKRIQTEMAHKKKGGKSLEDEGADR